MEIQIPIIMDKIATFLSHDDLKSCRQLNSTWNAVVSRTLRIRKSTAIQISQKSVKLWLASKDVFWNTVNLDWTFGDSLQGADERDDIQRFFQKFGQIVEFLNWTGADFSDEDHRISDQQLGEFLHLMPNLQELRLGNWELNCTRTYYSDKCTPATNVLLTLQNLHLAKLNSFHISHQAWLNDQDFDMLVALAPKLCLKKFTFSNQILGVNIRERNTTRALNLLMECWAKTLEELTINFCELSGLHRPMEVLRRFSSNYRYITFKTPRPLVEMFPVLEELNIYILGDFDWKSFLPEQMPTHLNLKSLKLIYNEVDKVAFLRTFVLKCPALKYLSSSIHIKAQDRTDFVERNPGMEISANGVLRKERHLAYKRPKSFMF